MKRVKYLVHRRTARATEGGTYIGLENIESGTGRRIETESASDGENLAFHSGDVLFGKLRPYLAKVFLADFNGVCTSEFLVLRPSVEITSRFLFYYVLSPNFIDAVTSFSFGAKMPRAEWDMIGNLELDPPPVAQQRAIADFLDRETAKIDDLIAKKERLIERLRERRRSNISRLTIEGTRTVARRKESGIPCVGAIPEHWGVTRNKNFLREIDDRSVDGTEDLLTVSHITGVSPRRENQQVTMFMAESTEGYKRCNPGDLVINTMWAWMGALGIANGPGIVSPSYNVYRFKQAAIPEYFHHLFRSPQYVAEIGRYSRGVWTSRLRLYPDDFLNMPSPVPPLEEQTEIATRINDENNVALKEAAILSSSLSLLREYRSSLISAAVTGQLDIPRHQKQLQALA